MLRTNHIRIKKYLWMTLRVILLVYIGLGAYLYFNQRNLLYFPEIGDPEACALFEDTGAKKSDYNGTTFYYKQNGGTLVVFYHGNGGTACDRKFLADFFDKQGVSYLFVEYAGYGDGRSSTQAALEENVRDAEEFIRKLSFNTLVIMGESLGSGLAVYHATLHAPDKMILVSPYTSVADVAAAHYRVYPARLMIKDNYRIDFGGRNFGGKLLVIHGREDEIIPLALGEEVFRGAPFAEKKPLFVDGAGHNDLFDHSIVFKELAAFFTK